MWMAAAWHWDLCISCSVHVQLVYHCWLLCSIRQLMTVCICRTVYNSVRWRHQLFTVTELFWMKVTAVSVCRHQTFFCVARWRQLTLDQTLWLVVITSSVDLFHIVQICQASVIGMLAFYWWHRHLVIAVASYTQQIFRIVGLWRQCCWTAWLNWQQTTVHSTTNTDHYWQQLTSKPWAIWCRWIRTHMIKLLRQDTETWYKQQRNKKQSLS